MYYMNFVLIFTPAFALLGLLSFLLLPSVHVKWIIPLLIFPSNLYVIDSF
jgi:hypothetical protein